MRTLILLTSLLFLAGCASQVPVAVNHRLSSQLTMRASHHWDVLAGDVAAQTAVLLRREARKDATVNGKALYLPQPLHASAFDQAFRNFLITRLVQQGLSVTNDPGADAIELHYETQVVHHAKTPYAHVPGTLTALGAGVWVVRELAQGAFAVAPGSLGLAALADWGAGKFALPSRTELIVTTSIYKERSYLMRKSDLYYLDSDDTDLYLTQERGVKVLEVVGR